MKIILILVLVLIVFTTVLLVKTVMMKPTPAKMLEVPLDTSERADVYGERLARMVRHETISWRDQEDRTKFYEFHKLLEELFPNVHATCEKHVFDVWVL